MYTPLENSTTRIAIVCMPIAFELQQGLPFVLTNLPNLKIKPRIFEIIYFLFRKSFTIDYITTIYQSITSDDHFGDERLIQFEKDLRWKMEEDLINALIAIKFLGKLSLMATER